MDPIKSLEILVGLLGRTPMSPAEQVGAQTCVDALEKALKPKDEPKPEAVDRETRPDQQKNTA